MAYEEALESVVPLLATTPDQTVETLLVSIDALVDVSDETMRGRAIQRLRSTADSCADAARRARLLRAADALAARQPCALTPEGLTWKEAAARQTAAQVEEDKRRLNFLVEYENAPADLPEEPEESEDEESEDAPYLEAEPPSLPHLRVRHFFTGLAVRVGRDFADAYGRCSCTGDLLKALRTDASDEGCTVSFLERTVQLRANIAGHDAIIENAGNAWFRPVPSAECLEDLWEAIDTCLCEAEEDDSDEIDIESVEALREDVDECRNWLSRSGERGPAPSCRSRRLAAKVFGKDHEMAQWIPLLYGAVAVLGKG